MTIRDALDKTQFRLDDLEGKVSELNSNVKKIVVSEIQKRWKFIPQHDTEFGLMYALCVDTKDHTTRHRVRYYTPYMHKPNSEVRTLDWANPCTNFCGFDDSGGVSIPPAGSMLVIGFVKGSRDHAVYLGTTWTRNRGPDDDVEKLSEFGGTDENHTWNFPITEYKELYEGNRGGNYFIGPNDGSQDYPPWNTDNYQESDSVSLELQRRQQVDPPSQSGWKTQEKHMIKYVDGLRKYDYKGKRVEILSSLGNWMLLKDDFLNRETWTNPQCTTKGQNDFFKPKNECWPYSQDKTPQGNASALSHTGIQLMSRGRHTVILDDRVQGIPDGVPEWKQCLPDRKFDFAEKYLGKIKVITTCGHRFEMSDVEDIPENRGEDNYIRLLSSLGNVIELNDHTINGKIAGWKRGITMQSTSRHRFEMIDFLNDHSGPIRSEIGRPADESESQIDWEGRAANKATAAFMRLRSGYGIQIELNDSYSQQETKQQYLELFTPNISCQDCGPHFMRFQELCVDGEDGTKKSDGYVWLRVAGTYLCQTCKDHVTFIGDKETYPSSKITIVTKDTFIDTEEYYMNMAQLHYFHADELIFLLAGKDCPVPGQEEKEPCPMPVLVMNPKSGAIYASDRVIGSASPDAWPVSIFQFAPFYSQEKQ